MKLKIPLIFHFNQDLVEFAGLASAVCYRGLLRVLLDAPVHANIQISGTLIQALRWIEPEPFELIREGLAGGKFELLGSTHAQNILIASDGWDNHGPTAHYHLSGRTDRPFELRIAAEIAGDYAENLRSGRTAVEGFIQEDGAGVRTASGSTIRMTTDREGGAFSVRQNFHAVTIEWSLALEGLNDEPVEFTLSLRK